jgi:LTXXQ motif family protein
MRLLPLALMLSVAAPLTGLSSTPSLAQSPAAPAPGASPPMMQGMPPEMTQMMLPMLRMMQRMHNGAMSRMALMGGPSGMMPGGPLSNLEGHIAFLKAELKITEPQQKAWDEFADALRTNAKTLAAAPNPMMGAMDPKLSAGARLDQQEKLLTLQMEALKRSRAALEPLSVVLADEQKKRLDELI